MSVTSAPAPFDRTSRAYRRRWWILAVLDLSLLAVVVDNSILNVAIPTLQRELQASTTQLQWIVDSYTLVFAGLLLTAGTVGDRYGRRGGLQFGMTVFGIGSVASALASTPTQLIVTRAVMGIGAAFIMPATLSIIANTFPPEERGRAIALWAALAGIASALGPISGGLLLAHFAWGSIFLVNVPIVLLAIVAGVFLIPTSRDPSHARLDVVGALLSMLGLAALVYAIIEAPQAGWTAPGTVVPLAAAVALLGAFAAWEAHSEHPMLDVSFFADARFTAASAGITLVFFAMFGAMFLLTQYFQLVMGYSAVQTGVRLLPMALTMMVVAPLSTRLVERFGTRVVVAAGMLCTTFALASYATLPATGISYPADVMWRMMVMAGGMGLVMAPATESIMGSLPRAKSGVGSAVNDTTRQVGGALGVAVIGSLMTTIYGPRLASALDAAGLPLPAPVLARAESGLGFALAIAEQAPPAVGATITAAARSAFVSGLHGGAIVAAVASFLGFAVVARWLPARPEPVAEPVGTPEVAAAPALGE